MRTPLGLWAAIVLLVAASCTSPLAVLKIGQTAEPVAPNQNRLVFHFKTPAKASYSYTTSDVGFLVVQVHSRDSQTSKFASSAVVGGTATVTFTGLVAGAWEVQASCYDWDGATTGSAWSGSSDPTQPELLFTGSDQFPITPGTSSSVSMLLYQPGDISGITLSEAKLVDTVSVVDSLSQSASTVKAGGPSILLTASALAADSTLASEQRFRWESDNPDVAPVNGAGMVFPKNYGTAHIKAVSVEGDKTGVAKAATYTLTVDPAIAGIWRNIPVSGPSTTFIKIYNDSGTIRWELVLNANTIAYASGSSPMNTGNKARGTASIDGSHNWTLNAQEYLQIGQGTFTNTWVASMAAAATASLDGSGHLVVGSPMNLTFLPVTNYVPVTSVAIVSPSNVYVATNTLVARLNGGTGAQPTIPAVFWQSSNSAYANFGGGYPASTGTWNPVADTNGLLQVTNKIVFAVGGTPTITLVSLDFDPVYRAPNSAPPGGYSLTGTYTPTILAGASASPLSAITIGATGNTVTSGNPITFWVMPTPLDVAAQVTNWTSSNPAAVVIGSGLNPTGTWAGSGSATITANLTSPSLTSNAFTVTVP